MAAFLNINLLYCQKKSWGCFRIKYKAYEMITAASIPIKKKKNNDR